MVDIGRPLNAALDDEVALPAVPGLDGGDRSLLGVVISHPHPDHYGLADSVDESVPLFIGEAAQRILSEAAFFSPSGATLVAAGYLRDEVPIEIGPFRVTPLLIDHSAYDSYALVIEAGGRRLLYSGDLRAHGRKRTLFERLVSNPPSGVHAFVLEGTHVRDTEVQSHAGLTEHEVEERCVAMFRETAGLVLACYSPQNIDRLVTFYRAARRADRRLVLDLYAATITRATGRSDTIPQAHWDGVRVFVPRSQRIRVRNKRAFEQTAWIKRRRMFPEALPDAAGRLVMTFRASMAAELEQARCLDGAGAVWSMWPGYLNDPSGQRLRSWMDSRSIPMTLIHSSGHATVADLQRLAAAVAAEQVVPIHTAAPHRFAALFDKVAVREDGEWWNV